MKEEQEAPTEIGCDIASPRRKYQPQNHQENHHDEKGHFRLGKSSVQFSSIHFICLNKS